MLKLLAVVTVFAIGVSGQPNSASNSKGDSGAQAQPTVIAPNAPDKHKGSQTGQSETAPHPPKWYAPLKRPEWWLVGLGFFTLGFIGWQAWETRKAAGATSKGLEITKTKQRAKLLLKLETINPEPGAFPEVKFTVTNAGESTAIIEFAVASLHLSESDILDKTPTCIALKIDSSMLKTGETSEEFAWLPSLTRYPKNIADQDPMRIHFYGLIVFDDAFEDKWRVKAHFIWRSYEMQVWVPHAKYNVMGEWEAQDGGGESHIPKPPKTRWGKFRERLRRYWEETKENEAASR